MHADVRIPLRQTTMRMRITTMALAPMQFWVARMLQLATSTSTLLKTTALASSWTHAVSVEGMVSPRVHATATATYSMLAGFAVATAFLLAPATAQEMYWMPAVFVEDRA